MVHLRRWMTRPGRTLARQGLLLGAYSNAPLSDVVVRSAVGLRRVKLVRFVEKSRLRCLN